MKVKLYTLNNCSYCERQKKIIEKIPSSYIKPIELEYSDISEKEKTYVDIKIFPTIAFFSDNGKILLKIDGLNDLRNILKAYYEASNLEKVLKKRINHGT